MGWRTIRRDSGLIEHACEHGVGHPNHYSAVRMNGYERQDNENTWFVHGCDGCCSSCDYPGRELHNEEIVDRLRGILDGITQQDIDWMDIASEIHKWGNFTAHDIMVNEGAL